MNDSSATPKIGLALGSGASRGWSHIGVIRALLRAGIEPAVICGTSVGAMVGASYAAGSLDILENWVLSSTRGDVLRFFDLKFSQAGFINVERFRRFLHSYVAGESMRIEDLQIKYIAVATDLDTGREVWCEEGNLAEAVRASMAMPGLFPAVSRNGEWLVDGGLVNPVPVTACRALGADVVIGVNLNAEIVGRRNRKGQEEKKPEHDGVLGNLRRHAREYSSSLFPNSEAKPVPPGMFYSIPNSIKIFQDRITRSRLAGDPADVLISPKVADIGLLEFQRAGEAMEKGEESVEAVVNDIRQSVAGVEVAHRARP